KHRLHEGPRHSWSLHAADIVGPGASLLAISGNDTNRVFNINEGYTITIANLFAATFTVSGCTLTGNQAVGGAGGAGGNGGNGFGGGIYNDGLYPGPGLSGPATLTVVESTITANQATGGAAGTGGSAGQGVGGGCYFVSGGVACLDAATV